VIALASESLPDGIGTGVQIIRRIQESDPTVGIE
jgi:hypothetical protein